MHWTRMSVVAVLIVIVAVPARAASVVDPTGAGPEAVAQAEAGVANWQTALSARQGCLGTATIAFGTVDGRKGEYNTRTQVVTIDLALPAAEVQRILLHELGHHAMILCRAYSDEAFTSAFYAAQGLPASRGWFDYSAGWSQTPAEHFAEALAAVVYGGGGLGLKVTNEGRAVMRAWMSNAPMPTVTAPESPTSTTTSTTAAVATMAATTPTTVVATRPSVTTVAGIPTTVTPIAETTTTSTVTSTTTTTQASSPALVAIVASTVPAPVLQVTESDICPLPARVMVSQGF